jgi:hypothetical protein
VAFNEKIVPNFNGVPREFVHDDDRPRGPRQLTQDEKDRCWRYARDQRISFAEAIRDLGLED